MRAGRILALALILSAVGLVGTAYAQEATVSVADNEFNPADIEVESGGTVTWTNNGDLPHTVTADNESFESGNMDPGDTFETTFTEAGTYSYYCEYHGGPDGTGMSGVVTVTGEDTDDPTDPPDNEGNGNGNGDDADPLPQTGADMWAFVYLAAAFIGTGAAFLRLQRA